MFGKKKEPEFKFNLGDKVRDKITGFQGILVCRSQWLHNCNTYGIQPQEMKDGKPLDRHFFDEPQLEVVEEKVVEPKRNTGGPEKFIMATNR